MDTSSATFPQAVKIRHKAINNSKSIGMCLGCGRRLTLCGKPFTADIECHKCGVINSYIDSQQPTLKGVRQ
jgi:hypothetical protein